MTVVVGTTQVLRARVRLERGLSAHLALSGVDPAGFFSWSSEIAYDQARS